MSECPKCGAEADGRAMANYRGMQPKGAPDDGLVIFKCRSKEYADGSIVESFACVVRQLASANAIIDKRDETLEMIARRAEETQYERANVRESLTECGTLARAALAAQQKEPTR